MINLAQGMTIVYSQSEVTNARVHLDGVCGIVAMPWNPDAVRWCTEPKLHGHDHNTDGGPAPWTAPKLS